jgi:hypothetical protein
LPASAQLIRVAYVAGARVLPERQPSCVVVGRALSPREHDVVSVGAQGLTSTEISHTL